MASISNLSSQIRESCCTRREHFRRNDCYSAKPVDNPGLHYSNSERLDFLYWKLEIHGLWRFYFRHRCRRTLWLTLTINSSFNCHDYFINSSSSTIWSFRPVIYLYYRSCRIFKVFPNFIPTIPRNLIRQRMTTSNVDILKTTFYFF